MQLLLTDRLSCPRCGPEFGLILLANRLEERRVHDGSLGCPNCRDGFTIRDGFADLRAPPRPELPAGLAGAAPPAGADGVEAERVQALLGISQGPGTVALVGEVARGAPAFAQAVEDVLVVAVDPDTRAWPEARGVSRLASAPGLPFFSRTLRGVAVDGRLGRPWIEEAIRVVAARSRVVVVHAGPEAASHVAEGGLSVLVSEAETVVAARG